MTSAGGDLERAVGRIVFPLDFGTAGEAVAFAGRLRGCVGMFKVGLEIFTAAGPSLIETLPPEAGIFLDLKFHDIPATVKGAARVAAGYGVRFVSVHAAGGARMMEAAVEGGAGRCGILAITALTSLDGRELGRLGVREDLKDPSRLVLHRASLAREAGCSGVVCSGQEVRAVKERFGEDFIALVPGVRPAWARVRGDDQARVTTPEEAVRSGADFLVVGRPIRLAADPVEATHRIAREIAAAVP